MSLTAWTWSIATSICWLKTTLVKPFADDEEIETKVPKWLRQQPRRIGKTMGQVYQFWWRICREINVFSMFEYHMFYNLYPFATYLRTLQRINVTNGIKRIHNPPRVQ
jgi:hypothetical protein